MFEISFSSETDPKRIASIADSIIECSITTTVAQLSKALHEEGTQYFANTSVMMRAVTISRIEL